MANRKPRTDVHADITAMIVEQLENATGIWECPWYRSGQITMPQNAATGRSYNGINVVALWAVAHNKGYTSGYWATYRQWASLGAQVRRGEKGARSVFYKKLTREDTESGEEITIPFARSATVFSAEQVDGYELPEPPVVDTVEAHAKADALIAATGASIAYDGGERAFYRPKTDTIHLPERRLFNDQESLYSTALHELVHWSGAPHRLARDKKASYAFEELVAELGAVFLCAELGIAATPRADHTEYLAGWLEELKSDNNAIARASAQASKAVEFIMEFGEAEKSEAA